MSKEVEVEAYRKKQENGEVCVNVKLAEPEADFRAESVVGVECVQVLVKESEAEIALVICV
jgi:hypothetical protein